MVTFSEDCADDAVLHSYLIHRHIAKHKGRWRLMANALNEDCPQNSWTGEKIRLRVRHLRDSFNTRKKNGRDIPPLMAMAFEDELEPVLLESSSAEGMSCT